MDLVVLVYVKRCQNEWEKIIRYEIQFLNTRAVDTRHWTVDAAASSILKTRTWAAKNARFGIPVRYVRVGIA